MSEHDIDELIKWLESEEGQEKIRKASERAKKARERRRRQRRVTFDQLSKRTP